MPAPSEDLLLPEPLSYAIGERLRVSVAETVAFRKQAIGTIQEQVRSLEQQELALHHGLHADVEAAIAGKRILLFKELLRETAFPQFEQLIHRVVAGFPVVGDYPVTGVLPEAQRLAKYKPEEL